MTAVRETSPGVFTPIAGNPTLISSDGQVKAPLQTILAPSWSAADRAAFGVHVVEPPTVPEGKQAVGQPRYEKQGDRLIEVRDLEDAPEPLPSPLDEIRVEMAALVARIAALEKR